MPRFDIAIVGAGCAGLSLAWHLLDAGVEGADIVLVDPRTEYGRDRTWCFFDVWPHPFESLITHRWARWRVRSDGPWVERSAPGLSYGHLPSDTFYATVRERLERCGVELRLGVRAGAVDQTADRAHVHTDAGTIEARLVFDSRPGTRASAPAPGEVSLMQHFEGWTVRCATDTFEPGVATLMDFAVSQEHGIHFLYVLPFDPRSALVEATWFSPRVHDWSIHASAIERHLADVSFEIVHRERGVIPMTSAAHASRWGRVYPIGLAGGLAKPSTGYAFVDIQRYSAEMARRVVREEHPVPPLPRPRMSVLQDKVFLLYLSRHPSQAAGAMVGMFEKLPADLVARFLHDRVTHAERVRVMRVMPWLEMSGALLGTAPSWLRS